MGWFAYYNLLIFEAGQPAQLNEKQSLQRGLLNAVDEGMGGGQGRRQEGLEATQVSLLETLSEGLYATLCS